MISILKGHGPKSLQGYALKGYHYDEHTSFTPIKQEIREALCREQGYICCYCMRRVRPNSKSMQIAHMKNQHDYPDLDCQYTNMIGSCSCVETCNQMQKMHDLKFYPTDRQHPIENFIAYSPDGTISSSDADFDKELNDCLNLNSSEMLLKQDREQIFRAVMNRLKQAHGFDEKKKLAHNLLKEWEKRSGGCLKEYCGLAIWILKRKLSKWADH